MSVDFDVEDDYCPSVEENEDAENDLEDTFEKLFPNLAPRDVTDPQRSGLMGAVCNYAASAFGADDVPTVPGFDDCTTNKNIIKYLDKDFLNDSMQGILKIDLEYAKNLRDPDWQVHHRCDAYPIFCFGGSSIRFPTIYCTSNPVWNASRYLPIRKRHIEAKAVTDVMVIIFDKDAHGDDVDIPHALESGEHLGTAFFGIDSCKNLSHDMVLELNNPVLGRQSKATLSLCCQLISIDEAMQQLGKGNDSDVWMEPRGKAEFKHDWPELAFRTDVSYIQRRQLAFVESRTAQVQAWVEVHNDADVVIVSFKGTESESSKVLISDAKPQGLGSMVQSRFHYKLVPSRTLHSSRLAIFGPFENAYESIRESILRLVYDITGWNDEWSVCFTGHGFGGALATIAAFEMANRKLEFKTQKRSGGIVASKLTEPPFSRPKFALISFGAPRVGNAWFARQYKQTVKDSLCIVTEMDPFPYLPAKCDPVNTEICIKSDGFVDISRKNTRTKAQLDHAKKAVTGSDRKSTSYDFSEMQLHSMGHLEGYYFDIISHTVQKFFDKEAKERGHAKRVVRSLPVPNMCSESP